MFEILKKISDQIKLARANYQKTVIVDFPGGHDYDISWEVIRQLAINGYHASFSNNYVNTFDSPVIVTEYEIQI